MAVVFETALELVFRQLLKAVAGQIIQPTRFKILLTRLENTLKSIEPTFYESWSLSKVLDHPEKYTNTFISYLENGKELVLKCSSNKSWTVYTKLLHSLKLIRLNKELSKFFQVQVEAKKISTSISVLSLTGDFDHEDKMGRVDSAVITPAGGYLTTDGGYPVQQLDLSSIGSFVNLRSIRFEQVSVSPYIQAISTMRHLQKLSFVMCEIGDAFMNGATLSPYMLPNLTGLEFESCYDLKELPSGICNLVHLQNLSITNCHELVALPKRLGSLSNLEILNLHCCTKLQDLPESIGSLRNLRFLDISDCLSISQLPERIGELNGLQVLKMSGVHGLQELPESMSKMSHLEEVICDEETSYLWMDFESDLYNLRINVVEDDRFGSFLKIVQ